MKYIALVFFSLFLASCTGEYFEHIEREQSVIRSREMPPSDLSGTLIVLPDTKALEDIVSALDQARDRIWIETYTWTEKETLEAALRAQKRGVDVRVVLEGSVYRIPWVNNEAIKRLKAAGVDFAYADNHRYTFTHIKTWIIDDTLCISTGNWSYTTFTKNREFIFCTKNDSLREDISEIIDADSRHVRPYFPDGLDPRLGLSPENVRPWLSDRIEKAEKSIIVYNQSVTDSKLLSELEKKAEGGVRVEICTAEKDDDETESGVSNSKNIEIFTSDKPYLHAKVFLLDGERVILGSTNMTQNALDNNREILIDLGKRRDFSDRIYALYQKDCHSSSRK